jgi:lon-related putative ATP-dependent protease
MRDELPIEKMRWRCDLQLLGCSSSKEVQPLEAIVGQARAVKALDFGLGIKEQGFNIYVAGVPGTGRTTAVKQFLEEMARGKPMPRDWCYVTNFRDSYRPKALSLPPGQGKELQADMKGLVEGSQREIGKAFESDEYAARREETVKSFRQKREDLFSRINKRAQEESFSIQATPIGLLTIPLKDGNPLSDEDFQALTPEEQAEISRKRDKLQDELKATFRQVQGLEKHIAEELKKVEREVAHFVIDPLIEDLKDKYQEQPEVVAYLEEVRGDILENLGQFRQEEQERPALPFPVPQQRDLLFQKYEVNVLVDNGDLTGAPVVMELNPTYNHLFGRIEKEAQFGALVTDFTMIRQGSLHRANGGYLVLPVLEVLRNLFSWDSLKRALRNREITIEEAGEQLGFLASKSLRPEPIPLDVKVILIGVPLLYHLLYALDEDFRELFKVKADFDTRMDRTDENIKDYVAFACTVREQEGLKHLDSSALAKIVEHGCRLAQDQEKLSTQFGEISDVIREASYYATQEGSDFVIEDHVKKAVAERFYRSNLLQERIGEMIERGSLMIDMEGEQAGQVNGLSVIDLGDIAFGRPNRITASIGLGREGLIDIEREAKLGGPIHTKGVMILSGYLAEKYAQDKPLSLSSRLVFEQSYSGVEGDSASSTELYAILSSLSGLPIKQGIAVTGSVNQKGMVQAIGGVNEKIEGFFEICKAKGMNGNQGVIIPASNVPNLMLKEEVVDAAGEGQFHLWAVEDIDEGIEILTGVQAGQRQKDGSFPEGTVNYAVDKRLRELSEAWKEFAAGQGEPKREKED